MLEYKFDTQLLIEGTGLDEDRINDYITNNIKGDCLLAVGDDELIKIHYHTNEPWQVLEYCASLGDIHDIVVENMERQSAGLDGLKSKKTGAGAHGVLRLLFSDCLKTLLRGLEGRSPPKSIRIARLCRAGGELAPLGANISYVSGGKGRRSRTFSTR